MSVAFGNSLEAALNAGVGRGYFVQGTDYELQRQQVIDSTVRLAQTPQAYQGSIDASVEAIKVYTKSTAELVNSGLAKAIDIFRLYKNYGQEASDQRSNS